MNLNNGDNQQNIQIIRSTLNITKKLLNVNKKSIKQNNWTIQLHNLFMLKCMLGCHF